MLSMKKIDTIRRYKFDLDIPIRTICYKLDVSPSTVYKYIKIGDDPHAFVILPIGYPVEEREQEDRFDKSRIHYIHD